jgi:protein phosphatase
MGGHLHGEVASGIAVEQVAAGVRAGAVLLDAIFDAHESVLRESAALGDRVQMGTTVVALRLDQHNVEYEVAWAGDSRAYLWAPTARLQQLTRDHSVVQELIDGGAISVEQASTHPHRNVITRALGGTRMRRDHIDRVRGRLRSGERILLCSDGLHKELDDRAIAKIIGEPTTDGARVQHLVDAALARSGDDNITAVLVSAPAGALARLAPTRWTVPRRRLYAALLIVVALLGGLTTYLISGRVDTRDEGLESEAETISG